MIFALYCFISALIFFLLGCAWGREDTLNYSIRVGFFFLFIVSVVFGMLRLKGFSI